jgi:hypothetical protein
MKKLRLLGAVCAAILLNIPLTAFSAPLASVTVEITGDGTLVSDPSGIDCPGTCSASFKQGGRVTLTATPNPGGSFLTYTGDCAGTQLSCDVLVNTPKTVKAFFDILQPTARLPVTGQTLCWPWDGVGSQSILCEGMGQDGDIQAGAPVSYTDNSDGTITDNNTKLMWEKKDDSGGIHDKDNAYRGEAFFDFADTLNNYCNGEGITQCSADDQCGAGEVCGFAGYRDWRVPNAKELPTIVNYETAYNGLSTPATFPEFYSPCFAGCTVTECSCTQGFWGDNPDVYITSTTALSAAYAFAIRFGGATDRATLRDVNKAGTHSGYSVRAVRGGL